MVHGRIGHRNVQLATTSVFVCGLPALRGGCHGDGHSDGGYHHDGDIGANVDNGEDRDDDY